MTDVVTIKEVVQECYDTKTFRFDWDVAARPGQFIMVWIPGVDEIPMSISGIDGIEKSITVKAIGEATRAIHGFKAGDRLRIRGPYGNGYDLTRGELLIIGGGVGTAAVMPAVTATGADTIIAARTHNDVIMDGVAEKHAANLWIATDDGSRGFHGNAVQLMREKVAEKHYDCVIACGPEVMLWFTYQACKELGLDCQLSLERYMKCGAGVCGCCVMDDSRVCRDGPVFDMEKLGKLTEFGASKRDECGRTVKFRWSPGPGRSHYGCPREPHRGRSEKHLQGTGMRDRSREGRPVQEDGPGQIPVDHRQLHGRPAEQGPQGDDPRQGRGDQRQEPQRQPRIQGEGRRGDCPSPAPSGVESQRCGLLVQAGGALVQGRKGRRGLQGVQHRPEAR